MPGVDPRKAAAATALRDALGSGAFVDELGKAGLRGADGSIGGTFRAPAGAPAAGPPPAPRPRTGGAQGPVHRRAQGFRRPGKVVTLSASSDDRPGPGSWLKP